MKKYIIIILIILLYSTIGHAYDNDDKIKKTDNLFFNYNYYLVFDTRYQYITSSYIDNNENTKQSIVSQIDFISQFKFSDNVGLSTDIRAIGYKTFFDDEESNISNEQDYTDIYFRSLYITYKLPQFDTNYKHMFALGTIPFQNGEWTKYKKSTPQQANGLSMMFDMTFDALVYVSDFSKYVDADMLQFRFGYGEHMKFANLYHQNTNIVDTYLGTTVGFINFDYKKDNHNIKLEAYHTDWKYRNIDAGHATQLGIGYSFDKLEDDGYVLYGTAAISKSTTGSFMDYYIMNTPPPDNTDHLSSFPPLDENHNFDSDDYLYGWAFDIGVRKEVWIEQFDVDWFIGAELFVSSDNWVATSVTSYNISTIDTSLRGHATDLYTGIKFAHDKVLTLSWIHENRRNVNAAINDINSKPDDTENLLKNRDIFTIEFTWLFH